MIAGISTELAHPVEVESLPSRPGDVKHSQADNSALMALVPGVTPTAFDKGLQATIEWFRAR